MGLSLGWIIQIVWLERQKVAKMQAMPSRWWLYYFQRLSGTPWQLDPNRWLLEELLNISCRADLEPFADYIIWGHAKPGRSPSVWTAHGSGFSAEETNGSIDGGIRGALSSPPYLRMHLGPLPITAILIRCAWKAPCPPSSFNRIIQLHRFQIKLLLWFVFGDQALVNLEIWGTTLQYLAVRANC